MGSLEKKIFMKHIGVNSLTIIAIILSSGFYVLMQTQIIKLLDAVMKSNPTLFLRECAIGLGLMVLICLSQFLSSVLLAKSTERMNFELRSKINQNISKLSYQDFHSNELGTYVSWLTNDVKQVEDASFSKIFNLFSNGASFIFACIALYSIHYGLLITALISAIVLMVTPSLLNSRMQKIATNLSESQELFTSKVKEVLQGFDVMTSYNLKKLFLNKLDFYNGEIENSKFTYEYHTQKYSFLVMLINFTAQLACIFVGAALSVFQLIPASAIISLGNLSGIFCNAVGGLATTLMSLTAGRAIISKFDTEELEEMKMQKLTDFNTEIRLDNLTYEYEGNVIFSNLNLSFEKGKKYAIMGPSGCGKSTILKIIMGYLDDFTGSTMIDGIDIKDYDISSIYEHVAYIDQDVYLFNTTIKDNITLFENIVDEQIFNETLRESALDKEDLILERLNDCVGENGKLLSGGQKQRIAIARALFNKKSIIIMDEGTSALDHENSKVIEESLLKNKDLTVILVTHHMTSETRPLFDKIYNMNLYSLEEAI